jgi:hypothetical protein
VNAVIAWLVAFMVAVAPTTRKHFYVDDKETPDEAQARYESIANDVVEVYWDPENPPLFSGPTGRLKTVSVAMSIIYHESQLRRDVDFGLGKKAKGDSGKSWCLMQVMTGNGRSGDWNKVKHRFKMWGDKPEDIVEGWTGTELVQDRKKCLTAGYRVMAASFAVCHKLPVSEWLRAYASGNCDDDGGGAEPSEARMNFGMNYFNRHKPDFNDDIVVFPVTETASMDPSPNLLVQ